MVLDVLKDKVWLKRLIKKDYRGLIPLFYVPSKLMDTSTQYDQVARSGLRPTLWLVTTYVALHLILLILTPDTHLSSTTCLLDKNQKH